MKHLLIGQRQKAPNFSAFHWSPHGCLITIGQHFVTTRVVHLPQRTETSLITESDQSRANHQLLQQVSIVLRVVKAWFHKIIIKPTQPPEMMICCFLCHTAGRKKKETGNRRKWIFSYQLK